MTTTREPIEPDDVYESIEWTTGRRLRRAADTLARTAGTASRTAQGAARSARQLAGGAARFARTTASRAAAPGGAVDWTEERLTRVLDDVSDRVPGKGERTDRVFSTAQSTVTVGARQARRLLRG